MKWQEVLTEAMDRTPVMLATATTGLDDDDELIAVAIRVMAMPGRDIEWPQNRLIVRSVDRDKLLKAQPVDNWKKKSNPNLKDHVALSHLDVRMVGILSDCTVKTPKPRPDGSVGQKWAILQIDDGATIGGYCFAKAWESCSSLETAVDRLVMLCGEVSHRINYEKDDKMAKRSPSVGDLNFTVREAYPLEDAMPMISDAMRIRLRYDDAEVESKATFIREAILRSPGRLPVVLEMLCPGGKVVDVSLGSALGVAVTVGFLSELGKVVQEVLYEDMYRKHRQERQEDARDKYREHVSEVAGNRHLEVLGHVGKCRTAFNYALIEYVEILFEEDDVSNLFCDINGIIYRNTDIGLLKRQAVVDAVTHVTDYMSL